MASNAFRDLAQMQADAMLTTTRVGDPTEDSEMSSMRPSLSRINALHFVTVDSQMGRKQKSPTQWQRAYISGFMPSSVATKFVNEMNKLDNVVALAFPHGEDQPNADKAFALLYMPTLSLTVETARLETCTSHPLAVAQPFKSMWSGLLPELKVRQDLGLMNEIKKEVTQVIVVDMTWGRPRWLFSKVEKVLRKE